MEKDELISKVEKIIKDKSSYNLLEVMGINRREVYICKILADLLDPNGIHGQGDVFLKLFFKGVLKIEDEPLDDVYINTEEVIDNIRRIDIFIKTKNYVIPIEAKIDADDQNSQCYDYYTFCEKEYKDRKVIMLYLTKSGYNPSEKSLNGLDVNMIKPISFKNEMLQFLDECKRVNTTEYSLCSAIDTTINAIRRFCCDFDEIDKLIKEDTRKNISILIDYMKENTALKVQLSEYLNNKQAELWQDYYNNVLSEVKKVLSESKHKEISYDEYKGKQLWITIPGYEEFIPRIYFLYYPEKINDFKGKPIVGIQIWKDENNKCLNTKNDKALDKLMPKIKKLWASTENDSLSIVKYNWVKIEKMADYNFSELDDKNEVFDLLNEGEMKNLVKVTVDTINKYIEKMLPESKDT